MILFAFKTPFNRCRLIHLTTTTISVILARMSMMMIAMNQTASMIPIAKVAENKSIVAAVVVVLAPQTQYATFVAMRLAPVKKTNTGMANAVTVQ